MWAAQADTIIRLHIALFVNGDLIEERLPQSLRFAPSLSGEGLPFDPVLGSAIRGAISPSAIPC
jgi:hypothetical protein